MMWLVWAAVMIFAFVVAPILITFHPVLKMLVIALALAGMYNWFRNWSGPLFSLLATAVIGYFLFWKWQFLGIWGWWIAFLFSAHFFQTIGWMIWTGSTLGQFFGGRKAKEIEELEKQLRVSLRNLQYRNPEKLRRLLVKYPWLEAYFR